MRYPCNHCGECSIWLAAFNPDTGLVTIADVISECIKTNCKLVGLEVREEFCGVIKPFGFEGLVRKD